MAVGEVRSGPTKLHRQRPCHRASLLKLLERELHLKVDRHLMCLLKLLERELRLSVGHAAFA